MITIQQAIEQQVCVWCKQQIQTFVNDQAKEKYNNTGLCQKCQDDAQQEDEKLKAAFKLEKGK